jgi:FixJ family two-component response regulator
MAKGIFVVDDEVVIADSLTAILNCSGYEARAFYDCAAALSACHTTMPECIISDVVMPRMTGIELAMRIRERFPECRIILFSGQAATSNVLEADQRSGHDFEVLLKPVHPSDLLARLAMDNQLPPPRDTLGPRL